MAEQHHPVDPSVIDLTGTTDRRHGDAPTTTPGPTDESDLAADDDGASQRSATAATGRGQVSAACAVAPPPHRQVPSAADTARANVAVPGASPVSAAEAAAIRSATGEARLYRAGPVNPEPPEPAQPPGPASPEPPAPAQPPTPPVPEPEPTPTPPVPGPNPPSPNPPVPEPTPPIPGPPYPPGPTPPRPAPPAPGPPTPPPGPPVPAPPPPPGPMPAPPFPPPPATSPPAEPAGQPIRLTGRAAVPVSAPPAVPGPRATTLPVPVAGPPTPPGAPVSVSSGPPTGRATVPPPVPLSRPVSAPPVVSAPALPTWPPRSGPASRRDTGAPAVTTSAGSALVGSADTRNRVEAGHGERYEGDLNSIYSGGTEAPGIATVAFPANTLETSGSLTGHILAQGWTETPADERSSTARVAVVLAASLGLLVAIGVLVVLLASDLMDGLMGNVLSG
ncbi:hypothetical protein QTQ03_21565 [Micromonospora sp. WMMA1363]|uniref:hypothetical protein n=1 Tax=Micromonospora sp. WMMA1363 TaxID=3053985 RepID=UPI00259C768E|nr:hypothetical protein [Micromonospora sp. WMMA1363]MDM4722048.1 hypothetical protein [Micromonospora sp. WMMA1363]